MKYQRKRSYTEAIKYNGGNIQEVRDFIEERLPADSDGNSITTFEVDHEKAWLVEKYTSEDTSHGLTMKRVSESRESVSVGDYVAFTNDYFFTERGIKFEETYEEVV